MKQIVGSLLFLLFIWKAIRVEGQCGGEFLCDDAEEGLTVDRNGYIEVDSSG